MISLIMTVKNEHMHLPAWFESIQKQTVQPDEIVIVDGGSTDRTVDLLGNYADNNKAVRIYTKAGNISVGRNEAIRQAKGNIIIATDAGCTYDSAWIERLVTTLREENALFVTTAFGPWLEMGDSLSVYGIAAATIPAPHEFQKKWLPSSRTVAFRKELWEKVGGYPEWLPICEDIVFDLTIQQHGVTPVFLREPLVFWRPRATVGAYLRQLFGYTRSDGHAKLFLHRQLIRYTVYGVSILFALYGQWIILGVGVLIYMWKFWRRWWMFTKAKSLFFRTIGFLYVPLLVALGDGAKMLGWIVGVWERRSGKVAYRPLISRS
ncbi:MAG TPA: glycosyltransferase [Candidatus Kapabacteria bacterium]|nr:glycosyltransferase [Candidatus Kapabacteria bacterium]